MTHSSDFNPLGISPNWQSAASNPPPLREGEIHLWSLRLTLNQQQTAQAISLLSDIQRDKYHRRSNEQLKTTYLAGRYYLLSLLGQYLNIEPHRVMLSYSRLNKPYLSDKNSTIRFNFTDTAYLNSGQGIFVFARNRDIGVDIERLNRNSSFAAIAADRFSESERAFIATQNGSVDPHKFLAIWTRKEAYGKATGQGINYSMKETAIMPREQIDHDKNQFHIRLHQRDWQVTQLQLKSGLLGCIVCEGKQAAKLLAFDSSPLSLNEVNA